MALLVPSLLVHQSGWFWEGSGPPDLPSSPCSPPPKAPLRGPPRRRRRSGCPGGRVSQDRSGQLPAPLPPFTFLPPRPPGGLRPFPYSFPQWHHFLSFPVALGRGLVRPQNLTHLSLLPLSSGQGGVDERQGGHRVGGGRKLGMVMKFGKFGRDGRVHGREGRTFGGETEMERGLELGDE